jgi:hypothetical protein
MTLIKLGSLVKHKVVHRQTGPLAYRLGIAIREVKDNPYLKDCWRVAWIPTKNHPVSYDKYSLYVDHVKKQNLILLSS